MVKAKLPESQNQAGKGRPGGNDGDTHFLLNWNNAHTIAVPTQETQPE